MDFADWISKTLRTSRATGSPKDDIGGVIQINGKTYRGNNIQIKNDRVWIDGVEQGGEALSGVVEVRITGTVRAIECDAPVVCEDVQGYVDARGPVTCGNVRGDVWAEGPVTCGDVGMNVHADGPVNAARINGHVHAKGSVS